MCSDVMVGGWWSGVERERCTSSVGFLSRFSFLRAGADRKSSHPGRPSLGMELHLHSAAMHHSPSRRRRPRRHYLLGRKHLLLQPGARQFPPCRSSTSQSARGWSHRACVGLLCAPSPLLHDIYKRAQQQSHHRRGRTLHHWYGKRVPQRELQGTSQTTMSLSITAHRACHLETTLPGSVMSLMPITGPSPQFRSVSWMAQSLARQWPPQCCQVHQSICRHEQCGMHMLPPLHGHPVEILTRTNPESTDPPKPQLSQATGTPHIGSWTGTRSPKATAGRTRSWAGSPPPIS
jgi:hypothetical protein